MREADCNLESEVAAANIGRLSGQPELESLPQYQAINALLEKMDPAELEKIVRDMASAPMRSKAFDGAKNPGGFFMIIVDGTGLGSENAEHGEGCLRKVYYKKDENGNKTSEIDHIAYYRCVPEAKLYIGRDCVVSFATEFVENGEDVDMGNEKEKQDCELKAFDRLAEKIRKRYPNLKICLLADALYVCQRVFAICKKFGWQLIFRFKEGRIPSLADTIDARKSRNRAKERVRGSGCEIIFMNNIEYKAPNGSVYKLNVVELDDGGARPFVFLTTIHLDAENAEHIATCGRMRWKIENEGNNRQKNHGYYLEHAFSRNWNARKNHYFLIQIAHAISQLMEAFLDARFEGGAIKDFHQRIRDDFVTKIITAVEIEENSKRFQVRVGKTA
jgi:hypothetical protein